MLTFHPLILRRRTAIADDAVCLELEAPGTLAQAYRYEAGQHLAVRATIDGREVRRTYSLVGPAGDALKLGIRVQGEMSRYLAEVLPIGGVIEAMEPSGRFKPGPGAGPGRHVVALAAGSGITPVLSIVATILATDAGARVSIYYGNRTVGRTMFIDEIMALKDRYLGRFSAQFLLTGEPQEVALFNGRLDAARVSELARTEFDPGIVDEYYVCGPGSMVSEVTQALKTLGARGKIHFERFSTDTAAAARPAPAASPGPASGEGADVEVSVTMDGRRRTFSMAAGGVLLDAAERSGLALPYSCRAGVCSTCRVKVVSGSATMDRNQALEDWEVQAGYVLCCQARPTTDRIELSYDDR